LENAVAHAKLNANKPMDERMKSILGEKTEDNKVFYEKQTKEMEEWITTYKTSVWWLYLRKIKNIKIIL